MKKKPGVIAGYAMKHLFKKPATISYPYDKLKIEPNYRGKLKYDADDCIGCNLCVRDCPTGAIKIINVGTKEDKKFECHLDLGHCSCGLYFLYDTSLLRSDRNDGFSAREFCARRFF